MLALSGVLVVVGVLPCSLPDYKYTPGDRARAGFDYHIIENVVMNC
jgi:hypothetical protein